MESKKRKISSEQLMHFVGEEKYLIEILNHNFYPRLCREDSINPFFKSNVYVPMKCFCDIPLGCLKDHIITYGQYGVGFKKSWGVKVGLTPVIYYNNNCPYVEYMREIYNRNIKHTVPHEIKECVDSAEIIKNLKSSFTMYKPIYGKHARRQEFGDNYCFYDEREWRYLIPANSKNSPYLQINDISQHVLDTYNGVEENGVWKPGRFELENQIKFTYDDIDFVVIPPTCDKNEIIEKLAVPKNDIDKIKDRITTLEALIVQKI